MGRRAAIRAPAARGSGGTSTTPLSHRLFGSAPVALLPAPWRRGGFAPLAVFAWACATDSRAGHRPYLPAQGQGEPGGAVHADWQPCQGRAALRARSLQHQRFVPLLRLQDQLRVQLRVHPGGVSHRLAPGAEDILGGEQAGQCGAGAEGGTGKRNADPVQRGVRQVQDAVRATQPSAVCLAA